MRDLHNHLLFGIDDGSTSIDESIKLLNEMEKSKVTDIMLTPHYIAGSDYCTPNSKKRELIEELRKHTNINLYLGNEVYIDNNIVTDIRNDKISTLNGSRYVLIEFPLNEKLEIVPTILNNVIKSGYIPIIAHPERYHYYDLEFFEELIDAGCLLQGNITSLCGKYGSNAKHNLELLVRKHMIHLMGTDTHRSIYPLNECYVALSKIVNLDMYKDITANNFLKVVNNEKIEPYEIVKSGKLFTVEKIK